MGSGSSSPTTTGASPDRGMARGQLRARLAGRPGGVGAARAGGDTGEAGHLGGECDGGGADTGHDVRPTGPMQITPAGKGLLIQNMVMRILVEKGHYTDPETWDELSPDVQNAWMVIAAARLSDPAE